MPPLGPAAHSATDGRLIVSLAALAIGCAMLGAIERQQMSGAMLPARVEQPAIDDASTLGARREAAPRRAPDTPTMAAPTRVLAAAPRARLNVAGGADPRDDLLALAALQRRWGLPSASYATGFFEP